jgi:hypothetical protein
MPLVASTTEIDALARRFARAAAATPSEFVRARKSIARAAGTEAKRAAVAVYNLSQSRVADDMRVIENATGVIVSGSKKTISFLSYGFRQTRKGLAGRIKKKGKRAVFDGSFIGTGIGGGKVPFWRIGAKRIMKMGHNAGKRKQPLHSLHGPSVADMFKDSRVATPLRERIWERARRELTNRLARITRRAG